MMHRANRAAWAALLLFWSPSWGRAQELDAPQPVADAVPEAQPIADDAGEIGKWIEQLDAPQFAKRQAASQKLFEAGIPAIPPLTEAARGDSREVTVRAIDILKRHAMTGGEMAKDAAREALNQLAQGEHKFAARAAQEALKPRPEDLPKNRLAPPVPNGLPGIQLGNGGIQMQIQAQAIGGAGRRTQVQIINGNKTIVVEEPNRKVRIEETAAGAIKLEITETKDGKATTRKFDAKSEDDLKQKHPDAHKIYQEFRQQGGNIQIGIGGVPAFGPNGQPGLPGNALPGQPLNPAAPPRVRVVPLPARPPNAPGNAAPNIAPPPIANPNIGLQNDARRQLEAALEALRNLPPDTNPDAPEFRKALQQVERSGEQLRRALK